MEEDLSIFTKKELFRLAHDSKGNSNLLKLIPPIKRRKIMDDNMHLMEGMRFRDDFPISSPYTGRLDFAITPFTERKRIVTPDTCIHFFLDDYKFRNQIWYNLERVTYELSLYDYLFTPDLSLWRNLKTEFFNLKNLFRTRFIGAYWELCGFNVIHTASWGGLESFEYCFKGLPSHSILAVSGMSARKDKMAFSLWCYGIHRLIQEKYPLKILVYGGPFETPDFGVPIEFLPTFISKRFR